MRSKGQRNEASMQKLALKKIKNFNWGLLVVRTQMTSVCSSILPARCDDVQVIRRWRCSLATVSAVPSLPDKSLCPPWPPVSHHPHVRCTCPSYLAPTGVNMEDSLRNFVHKVFLTRRCLQKTHHNEQEKTGSAAKPPWPARPSVVFSWENVPSLDLDLLKEGRRGRSQDGIKHGTLSTRRQPPLVALGSQQVQTPAPLGPPTTVRRTASYFSLPRPRPRLIDLPLFGTGEN